MEQGTHNEEHPDSWTFSEISDQGERVSHLYPNDCYFAHLAIYYFALDHAHGGNILDAGWGLGVNGIATFKNAESIRDIYRRILPTKVKEQTPEFFYTRGIYFETDAPWISPEGKRGQRNEPANIKDIYEQFISQLYSKDV